MKNYHIKRNILGNSHGGVLVLVAILMVVFLSIAALAIDIGKITTTRNELQDVADAAALAGAAEMGTIYVGLTPSAISTYVFTKSTITGPVLNVAILNKAANVPIVIRNDNTINAYDLPSAPVENDIVIGTWDESTGLVTPTLTEPDAVYVKARRDNTENSPITTFFAGMMGIEEASVTAEAVAALSGPSTVAEGELELPIGLSSNVFLFPNTLCSDLIAFSPTPSSCAAYHNFGDAINANNMKSKMFDIIAGDDCVDCIGLDSGIDWLSNNFGLNLTDGVNTPSSSTGDFFDFQGGAIAALMTGKYLLPDYDPPGLSPGNTGSVDDPTKEKIAPFLALFDYFRYRDGDGNDAQWSTTIPVYQETLEQTSSDSPDCENANSSLEVIGYAEVALLKPNPPPDNTLSVQVKCDLVVAEGRGGGGGYSNIIGSIPTLVK